MLKIKQIKTLSPFKIRLNYWAHVMITPLANFRIIKDNVILHLMATESDTYSLVYINPNPTTQYDELKPIEVIPAVVLKVLKELPDMAEDAEPIEFVERISDVYDE